MKNTAADFVSVEHVAGQLASSFAREGHPCEIEAGNSGLLVYAASRASAKHVGESCARTIRAVYGEGLRVVVTAPAHDANEPEATAWCVGVEFDPRRLG